MVCEFTSEFIESLEILIESVLAIIRADESTVPEAFEDTIDSVSVVVAHVGEVRDCAWLVEIIEYFESFPGQEVRKLDVGVLTDEVLVYLDRTGVGGDDSFSTTISLSVAEPSLGET